MLETRDFELIQQAFNKRVDKVSVEGLFEIPTNSLCHTYRKYDSAYFEEIILTYNVEKRVAQNYRERHLITNQAIF